MPNTHEVLDAPTHEVLDVPRSDYEAWRDLLRSMCGRYYSEAIEPKEFSGWVQPVSVRGFTTLDIGSNAPRVERTYRDIRLDGADHFFALFPASGRLTMLHNGQAVRLGVGDVALVDSAKPVTYSADDGELWNTVSLSLPRQSLISHLGFEPQGGVFGRKGAPAGRLLFELIRASDDNEGSEVSSADSYMRLAVFDLVGALFAPSEPWSGSRYTDKLFGRIRAVIRDGFADPDFGPDDVSAQAGISLRYLQKLFTQRSSTCTEYIYSSRLDHAAQLLRRRGSLRTSQPLSEIAHACGFRDYTHFARKFRHRFGYPPGAHAENLVALKERTMRTSPAESAPRAHDARSPAA